MNIPSTPRTDLAFLRRRRKPGRTEPAPASVTSTKATSTLTANTAAGTETAGITSVGQAPASGPPTLDSLSLRGPSTATGAGAGAPRSPGLVLGRGAAAPSSRTSTAAPSRSTPPASTRAPSTTSATSARAQTLAARREKATLEDREVQLLFPAPGIEDVYELNFVDRVLRLSAVQSAIGTLVVSGSTAIAWENMRGVTGGQTVDGHKAGTPVTTAGNRALVGYHGREALVSLRHVREMRRAIFINRSTAPMGVQLFSGDTVALPPAAGGTQMVLLVHRIGNVLELRAEPVPHDWPDVKIWQEFDFSMTHRAPATAYGR